MTGTPTEARRARLRSLLALGDDERADVGRARLDPRGGPAAPQGVEGVRVVADATADGPDGGDGIPAFLVRPDPAVDTGAGVVLVPGHGRGIDALVDEADPYHHGLARSFAEAGVTVLCPEPLSFGRRRFPRPPGSAPYEPGENSCEVDATRFLLWGRPVMGRRVADAAAAVSALRGLDGVDPDRVGVAGGSGGGAVALLLAAADPAVAGALVATYFSSFAASIGAMRHCACNILPGFLPEFEMADVAALVAPRPLVLEAGEQDPIFPVAAARESFARLTGRWGDRVAPQLVLTPEGHRFVGEESRDLLVTALGAR